jgi:hypothetical protein
MLLKCSKCGEKHQQETNYMAVNLVKCGGVLVIGKMPFRKKLSYSKYNLIEAFDPRPLSLSYRWFRFTEAFRCWFV